MNAKPSVYGYGPWKGWQESERSACDTSDVKMIENPNTHHAEPYLRHLPNSDQMILIDGDTQ